MIDGSGIAQVNRPHARFRQLRHKSGVALEAAGGFEIGSNQGRYGTFLEVPLGIKMDRQVHHTAALPCCLRVPFRSDEPGRLDRLRDRDQASTMEAIGVRGRIERYSRGMLCANSCPGGPRRCSALSHSSRRLSSCAILGRRRMSARPRVRIVEMGEPCAC